MLKALKEPSIESGLKLYMLNEIFVNPGVSPGRGLQMYTNVTHALHGYRDLLDNHLENIFIEVHQKYNIDKKIIYDLEEDPIYVLYQSWSGELIDSEVQSIHDIAERGLKENVLAIRNYWAGWYFPDKVDRPDSVDTFQIHNRLGVELLISLRRLLEITKEIIPDNDPMMGKVNWWKTHAEDKEIKELIKLRPNNRTIRADFTRITPDLKRIPRSQQ